jgi:hypothetical protein
MGDTSTRRGFPLFGRLTRPFLMLHVQYPFPEVYVAPLKSHGLSEPQAGAGQREQERIAVGVVPLCHIEQCGQLPTSECGGGYPKGQPPEGGSSPLGDDRARADQRGTVPGACTQSL